MKFPDRAEAAFNVFNAETVLGVVAGVEEAGGGCFLQTSAATVRFYSAGVLGGMVRALGPVGLRGRVKLHLDHCGDVGMIRDCLEAGWDSVMMDASGLPLEENIRETRAVVELAARYGALVEGEIGVVGREEDGFAVYGDEAVMPRVAEVLRFMDESGAAMVAVGVGTRHGHYGDRPCELRHDLLEAVHAGRPSVPLVLHGGTGIAEADVARAVRRGGVRKVNISTLLKDGWLAAQRAQLASSHPYRVTGGLEGAVREVREAVLPVLRLLEGL